LQQSGKEMELELFSLKKEAKKVDLQNDGRYEDRVKQLLNDLELQAKDHLQEIQSFYDQHRILKI